MARWVRWLPLVSLGIPVVLAWATLRWVSLIPQIDQRFFFTPGSPIYRAHQKIEERYSGQDLLVVIAAGRHRLGRLPAPDPSGSATACSSCAG